MGSNLGMSIVVEGVETDAQRILVQKELHGGSRLSLRTAHERFRDP